MIALWMYAQLLSWVQLFGAPWTVACQIPLSIEFSRQVHWSELSFPPLGDLLNPYIKPMSLASPASAGGFFTTSATWEALLCYIHETNTII